MSSTKCIAHRGDNKNFFENSISSLVSAIELGSHGVEFDVVHTKDNIPLVFHDKTLARLTINKDGKTCPFEKKISRLTYQSIRQNCLLKNGEEIPLLEDYLKILEPLNLYKFIELKDKPTDKTFSLIKKYSINNPASLRVISFKKKYLKKVRTLAKSNDFWKEVRLLAVYRQAFMASRKYGVNIHHSALKYMRILKRKNRELGIWTADKQKLMTSALRHKLDFITTNDPELCLQVTSSL